MSTYKTVNPYTNEVIKDYDTFSDAKIKSILKIAYDTYNEWKLETVSHRQNS